MQNVFTMTRDIIDIENLQQTVEEKEGQFK